MQLFEITEVEITRVDCMFTTQISSQKYSFIKQVNCNVFKMFIRILWGCFDIGKSIHDTATAHRRKHEKDNRFLQGRRRDRLNTVLILINIPAAMNALCLTSEDYKYLAWIYDVDRKICHECH